MRHTEWVRSPHWGHERVLVCIAQLLILSWLGPKRQPCRGTVEQSAFQQDQVRVPADLASQRGRGILVASSANWLVCLCAKQLLSIHFFFSFSLVFCLSNLTFWFIFCATFCAVGRLWESRAPHKQTLSLILTLRQHYGNRKCMFCFWFSVSQNTFQWRFLQRLCKLIMIWNTFTWKRWRIF